MSKTKNQIINEVIDATIARLTPADTPETICEDVTQDIEALIVLENISRGKGSRLRGIEVLPNPVTAQLMAGMFPIRCVACAGLETDPKFDLLCLYQESGPDAGTYMESDNELYKLAIRYNVQLTENGFKEICRRLRGIVPRVARTMDPDLIAVNNGIFNFRTKELLPFSPDYVFLAKSHVNYDPDAVNVTIHNGTDDTDWDVESWVESLSDDPEIVELLWQIMGAIVRPFVPWNKSAWFYSEEGNNGKGTLCALMKQLCGETAVATIPISDFGKDFMLEPLTRATAIIVDENDVGTFIDKAANLKAVVTGDEISINRKFMIPIRHRFFGFMVQCVNEVPRVKDKSDSFYRRQLVVPFTKCFTGRERKYIKNDYLRRPEVLQYVLYRVLNMDFYELDNPAACQAVLQEYKELNDPVRQFFQDVETRFAWQALPFEFIYDLYKGWSSKYNPSGMVLGRNNFQKALLNVVRGSTIWYAPGVQFRTKKMMDAPEPMIIEYNLKDWMNPVATASSNPDVIAKTKPRPAYRGLLRYGCGADGDDNTDDDNTDDNGRTEE